MKYLKLFGIVWALPATIVGLVVGTLSLPWGGRVRIRSGCVEFYGRPLAWLLGRLSVRVSVSAMTLGHVILGRNEVELDEAFRHERVHVHQYERWGPFFVPAYLGVSVYLWLRGRDPYWDNPFEVEAYRSDLS